MSFTSAESRHGGSARLAMLPCEGINVMVGRLQRIAADSSHVMPIEVDISPRPRIAKITGPSSNSERNHLLRRRR